MQPPPSPIILGPFFTPSPSGYRGNGPVRSLELAVEWSSEQIAVIIQLFRKTAPHARGTTRFQDIVFRKQDLPWGLDCAAYQVFRTHEGTFLPLDALLGELYRRTAVARPVFCTLKELATAVALEAAVTAPTVPARLLLPDLESLGFRLQRIFRNDESALCQICWEPDGMQCRFHVSNIRFHQATSGSLARSQWIPQQESGICCELERRLRSLVTGEPADLLSEAGLFAIRGA